MGIKIPPAVFRHIEHELYNYDQTKKALEESRLSIIHQTPGGQAGGGGSNKEPGDPTGSKAIKLLSTPTLLHMERVVHAIDTALKMLNDDHRALFELKYRQGLGWQEVCQEMPCSERTYFRLRRRLVVTVGVNLGVIDLAEGWQE